MTDPIDDYLDDLVHELARQVPHPYRIASEAEAHLRDAQSDLQATGMDADAAAAAAVTRFGAAPTIGRWFRSNEPARGAGNRAALVRLVAVALIGVGMSGLLLLGVRIALPSEVGLDSSVLPRLGAGLVGLVAIESRWWSQLGPRPVGPPKGLHATVGASAFGAIALITGTAGLTLLAQGDLGGASQWLTAGVAALGLAVAHAHVLRSVARLGRGRWTSGPA